MQPDPLCPCGSPRLLGHAGCPRCEDVRRTLYVQHAPGPLALPTVEPPDRPMGRAQALMSARRNPLWAAYAATTDSPTNAGFMAWVSGQAAAFRKVHRMGRFDRLPREAWVRWCESTPSRRSQP